MPGMADEIFAINVGGYIGSGTRSEIEYHGMDLNTALGTILKTKSRYPVLHLTYNGEHYSEVISRQKIQALKKKLETKEVVR